METMNLSSIKDRAWQIQACSAITGEGLQVMVEIYSSLSKYIPHDQSDCYSVIESFLSLDVYHLSVDNQGVYFW